jgi:protocatechuate 3,4-dioxygenase beta subunit
LNKTELTRRDLLSLAAKGAASVLVSQSFLACASGSSNGADTSLATANTGAAAAASSSGGSSCVLTASLEEGPFFVDEKLNRADIRTDPVTGAVSTGIPLALTFNVSRVANNACTPLTGAYLDVWHCDSGGIYSDVDGSSQKFLRGYQVTDPNGIASFATVYPGWYPGRTVHIHFKLRLPPAAGSARSYDLTSQFFFDEALTDAVHTQSPYNSRGARRTRNANDRIYNSLSATEKAGLTLQTSKTAAGYAGVINLGVNIG